MSYRYQSTPYNYTPRTLSTDQRARWENVQMMRDARLGIAANDGSFGGNEYCRRVMQNCEQFMVTRPKPWPWQV